MRHDEVCADDETCHLVGVEKCQGWVDDHGEDENGHLRVGRSLGIVPLLRLRDEILYEGEIMIIEQHVFFIEWRGMLPGSPFHILRRTWM